MGAAKVANLLRIVVSMKIFGQETVKFVQLTGRAQRRPVTVRFLNRVACLS